MERRTLFKPYKSAPLFVVTTPSQKVERRRPYQDALRPRKGSELNFADLFTTLVQSMGRELSAPKFARNLSISLGPLLLSDPELDFCFNTHHSRPAAYRPGPPKARRADVQEVDPIQRAGYNIYVNLSAGIPPSLKGWTLRPNVGLGGCHGLSTRCAPLLGE